MSFRSVCSVAVVLSVVSGAAMLGGCETTKEKQLAVTRSSAAELRTQLSEMSPQVDKTMAAMDAVLLGKGDSKDLMKSFSNEIGKLQSQANVVRREADSAISDADGYFAAWSKELANAKQIESRDAGAAKMELTRANFNSFQSDLAGAKTDYNRFLGNLTDVKLAMEKNPGAALSADVKKYSSDAVVNAANVKNRVNALLSRINGFLAK